ncbi:MAG: DUF2530 domain-containing protein [Pseudonocardiaceae bacterium]
MAPIPPPLPRGLADPRPVVTLGTIAWFVAAVVFRTADGASSWTWTCVVGGLLGLLGLTMIYLQRRAARHGSRTAQRGLMT